MIYMFSTKYIALSHANYVWGINLLWMSGNWLCVVANKHKNKDRNYKYTTTDHKHIHLDLLSVFL